MLRLLVLLAVIAAAAAITAGFSASPFSKRVVWTSGPPPPPPSLWYNANFQDNAVLQRGPNQATVYGGFTLAPGQTNADVTVQVIDLADAGASYTLQARTDPKARSWKALLRPAPAGGRFEIATACTSGCSNSSAIVISNITFGDVFFCSGQSNSRL
jgi:hypothetical protein